MKKLFLLFLGTLAILLGSCATSQTNSVVNSAYSSTVYETIVVNAPILDVGKRQVVESAFVEEFARYGIHAYRAIDIMPPVKYYTAEEFDAIINQYNLEAVFFVEWTDAWVSTTTHSNSSTSYNSSTKSYQTQTNSYNVSKPREEFQLRMMDVNSGETTWMSTTRTGGNAYAGKKTMANSLSRDAVKTYAKDTGLSKI